MYEYKNNEILSVKTIATRTQTATVKKHVYTVVEPAPEPMYFESVPEKPADNYELHCIDGELVWVEVG
jgi:hypothetical protein